MLPQNLQAFLSYIYTTIQRAILISLKSAELVTSNFVKLIQSTKGSRRNVMIKFENFHFPMEFS